VLQWQYLLAFEKSVKFNSTSQQLSMFWKSVSISCSMVTGLEKRWPAVRDRVTSSTWRSLSIFKTLQPSPQALDTTPFWQFWTRPRIPGNTLLGNPRLKGGIWGFSSFLSSPWSHGLEIPWTRWSWILCWCGDLTVIKVEAHKGACLIRLAPDQYKSAPHLDMPARCEPPPKYRNCGQYFRFS